MIVCQKCFNKKCICMEKYCTVCKILKPLTSEFFFKKKNSGTGFRSECKECGIAYTTKYAKNHRAQRREVEKRYREKYPEKVKEMMIKSKNKNYNKLHYRNYINNAKNRGMAFELNFETFINLCSQPCFYCDCFPEKLHGLDRVDSALSYVFSNVVTACSDCNYAKQSLSQNEFFSLVSRIALKHKLVAS